MWTSNNALVPDPDKDDILASSPDDWPFLKLGLRMCGWGDNTIKFYLLGTPIIWWGSTISLGLAFVVLGWYVLRMQRQYRDWKTGEWEEWLFPGKVAFWGWFMHFGEFTWSNIVRRSDTSDGRQGLRALEHMAGG